MLMSGDLLCSGKSQEASVEEASKRWSGQGQVRERLVGPGEDSGFSPA